MKNNGKNMLKSIENDLLNMSYHEAYDKCTSLSTEQMKQCWQFWYYKLYVMKSYFINLVL